MIDELKFTHNKECEAYELIKDIKHFPKPETYYFEKISENSDGIIVMQDLSQIATTNGLFKSATVQQCLNLAKHFGNFQVRMLKTMA
jgi:hypothetical protein